MSLFSNTLFVFALQAEAQSYFNEASVLFCGVGKVNAAYALARALPDWTAQNGAPPARVINLGSAGSCSFKQGEIINCTQFVQRDMDARSLGCQAYATPFDNTPHILKNGMRFESLPEGICGTGDRFATDGTEAVWNVVDMEAYALAKVCLFEKIPFACFKYITDGADEKAALSWQERLDSAASALKGVIENLP